MDSATVAHRWANKDFGKNGTLTASSVRSVGRNYFSYSTVFGQWLDISKNVVAIFDGATSSTSSKHKLYKGMFPDDVHVFPLDFGSGCYGWHNCNVVSSYKLNDEDFKEYHRNIMIGHYVERMYDQFAAINGGKKKGLENVSFEPWGYIVELCSLYKDTSINKYLKWSAPKKDLNKTQKEFINRQRKLVRMLKDGERNVEVLTDALFGEGTFKKYWEYCARYRKAADKRAKVEKLCERLGIASPYERSCWRSGHLDSGLTADQIRKLTAKERIDLHFAAIFKKEHDEKEVQRRKKYDLNFRNAYKWIVGCEPKKSWCGYESEITICVNKDTGSTYECGGEYLYGYYWCLKKMVFDYDGFRKSQDKEQWISDFYAKCKEVADNRKAISILKRINAHTKEKERSWNDDVYLNDDWLRENTTDAEYALCAEFIRKQDRHYAEEEARRRAEKIERLRRKEERKREEEYRQQVKQEEIESCLSRGIEGRRDLWRKHLRGLYDICDKDDEFYMGGNVLLRLNLNKDKVETSKNIRMPLDVAKKFFRIIQKWHGNPKSFKEMQIDTKGSGRYTISSYKNDILTAGCHKIAYAEMERMYNEIIAAV